MFFFIVFVRKLKMIEVVYILLLLDSVVFDFIIMDRGVRDIINYSIDGCDFRIWRFINFKFIVFFLFKVKRILEKELI